MQEKQFLLCLRNPCENTFFKTSNIFCIYKKDIRNMLGYWPYATHKKYFYIFFCQKTQASQLITIKDKKPCEYILKVWKTYLRGSSWRRSVWGQCVAVVVWRLALGLFGWRQGKESAGKLCRLKGEGKGLP